MKRSDAARSLIATGIIGFCITAAIPIAKISTAADLTLTPKTAAPDNLTITKPLPPPVVVQAGGQSVR